MKAVYIKPIDSGHIKICPVEATKFVSMPGWFGPFLELPTS